MLSSDTTILADCNNAGEARAWTVMAAYCQRLRPTIMPTHRTRPTHRRLQVVCTPNTTLNTIQRVYAISDIINSSLYLSVL